MLNTHPPKSLAERLRAYVEAVDQVWRAAELMRYAVILPGPPGEDVDLPAAGAILGEHILSAIEAVGIAEALQVDEGVAVALATAQPAGHLPEIAGSVGIHWHAAGLSAAARFIFELAQAAGVGSAARLVYFRGMRLRESPAPALQKAHAAAVEQMKDRIRRVTREQWAAAEALCGGLAAAESPQLPSRRFYAAAWRELAALPAALREPVLRPAGGAPLVTIRVQPDTKGGGYYVVYINGKRHSGAAATGFALALLADGEFVKLPRGIDAERVKETFSRRTGRRAVALLGKLSIASPSCVQYLPHAREHVDLTAVQPS